MQLIIGLVAGIIIGWIIEWVIDWIYWRKETVVSLTENERLKQELATAQREVAELRQKLLSISTPEGRETPPVSSSTESDDLQKINGIGPVFEKRLNQSGIYTFAQLSQELQQISKEELQDILQLKEWQTIEVESWIKEATRLANVLTNSVTTEGGQNA